MPLAADLRTTLEAVATALAVARDPWWTIGSAAVALHLDADLDVNDVDVLLSARDARDLLPQLGLLPTPGTAHPRFRSALFATWRANPLPVEFMAEFRLNESSAWRSFGLLTRRYIAVGGHDIPVPSRQELKTLLERFGRAKDLARSALL